MVEGKFHVVNNISRIGENLLHLMVTNITSSLLHAICVYFELGIALAIEAMQLQVALFYLGFMKQLITLLPIYI